MEWDVGQFAETLIENLSRLLDKIQIPIAIFRRESFDFIQSTLNGPSIIEGLSIIEPEAVPRFYWNNFQVIF